MSAVGTVIANKFRLERVIGRGGMGAVWEARHLQLDIPVAVKLMEGAAAGAPDARQRFEREARAAAQIRSPNVVQILDHGVDGDAPYIAMELLDGEDLGVRLRRAKRLSLPAMEAILTPITKGLRRAHELGIVHRDLKPSNIFLAAIDDEEIVKLLDFGVAKLRWTGAIGEFTQTGTLLGSPSYMSPEQARGTRGIDHRSDLWSLAVIIFRAVTGAKPFVADSIGDLIVKLCIDPPPVASELVPGLPPALDAFFARAFEHDPEGRFQSASELAAAFSAIARASVAVLDRPPTPPAGAPAPPIGAGDAARPLSAGVQVGSPLATPIPPPTPPRASAPPRLSAPAIPAPSSPAVPSSGPGGAGRGEPGPTLTPPSDSMRLLAEDLIRGRAALTEAEGLPREPPVRPSADPPPPRSLLTPLPGSVDLSSFADDVAPYLAGGVGGPGPRPPPIEGEEYGGGPGEDGFAKGGTSLRRGSSGDLSGSYDSSSDEGGSPWRRGDSTQVGFPSGADSVAPEGTLTTSSRTLNASSQNVRRLIAFAAIGATVTAALVTLIILARGGSGSGGAHVPVPAVSAPVAPPAGARPDLSVEDIAAPAPPASEEQPAESLDAGEGAAPTAPEGAPMAPEGEGASAPVEIVPGAPPAAPPGWRRPPADPSKRPPSSDKLGY